MKLKVGDICKSASQELYLVLETDFHKPISLMMLESRTPNRNGEIFTEPGNSWLLFKVDRKISKLEAVIYGVNLENT